MVTALIECDPRGRPLVRVLVRSQGIPGRSNSTDGCVSGKQFKEDADEDGGGVLG